MAAFIDSLLTITILAFAWSLAAHVFSLLGIPILGDRAPIALHFGMFIVGVPTALIVRRFVRRSQIDAWRLLRRSCPRWMRITVLVLFVYAFLSFFILFVRRATARSGPVLDEREARALAIRAFSGHWVFFYFAIGTTLYSARRLRRPLPKQVSH